MEAKESCSYTSNTNVFRRKRGEDESKYIVNRNLFPSPGFKADRQPAVTSMTARPWGSILAQAVRRSLQEMFSDHALPQNPVEHLC